MSFTESSSEFDDMSYITFQSEIQKEAVEQKRPVRLRFTEIKNWNRKRMAAKVANRNNQTESILLEENKKFGLDIKKLKQLAEQQNKEHFKKEETQQEIALGNLKKFFYAVENIIKIQAWMRMCAAKGKYNIIRTQRNEIRRYHFNDWKSFWKAQHMRKRTLCGKCFYAWLEEKVERSNMSRLALELFMKSLQRPWLNSMTVTAYFYPQGWHGQLSPYDITRIRYMILQKVFLGWKREATRLQRNYFKASQAIIRANRKGQARVMWAQEVRSITFHIWHRLAATKSAFRLDAPPPYFAAPVLPEWTKLLQDLMSKRVLKKRCAHRAQLLIIMRSFKWWRRLQGMDLPTEVFNNEMIASNHYTRSLFKMVIAAWYTLSRERGEILRRREKFFRAWAGWAPRKRRLRHAKIAAREMSLYISLASSYRQWSTTCHEVIGRRIYTLRGLRRNLCDRNLWWSSRRRWKTALRQIRVTWHQCKAVEILREWSKAVKQSKKEREELQQREGHGTLHNVSDRQMTSKKRTAQALLARYIPDDANMKTLSTLSENEMARVTVRKFFNLLQSGQSPGIGDTNILKERPDDATFYLCCQALSYYQQDKEQGVHRYSVTDTEEAQSMVEKQQRQVLLEEQKRLQESTDKLQVALVAMDVKAALTAIEEGAQIQSTHISQMMRHFGVEYLPLLGVLLSFSPAYSARRVLKGDLADIVITAPSPLSAVMLGTHLSRWCARDVTLRELSSLSYDKPLSTSIGSRYQSVVLWRAFILVLLQKKRLDTRKTCCELPVGAGESEEIALIIRRQKYRKLSLAGRSLGELVGMHPVGKEPPTLPWQNGLSDILEDDSETFESQPNENYHPASLANFDKPNPLQDLEMGPMLREYLLLTGQLQEEAYTLRRKLLERDKILLRNGFEKQARLDYLALQEECMTPRTKSERDLLRQKESESEHILHSHKKKKKKAKKSHGEGGASDQDQITSNQKGKIKRKFQNSAEVGIIMGMPKEVEERNKDPDQKSSTLLKKLSLLSTKNHDDDRVTASRKKNRSRPNSTKGKDMEVGEEGSEGLRHEPFPDMLFECWVPPSYVFSKRHAESYKSVASKKCAYVTQNLLSRLVALIRSIGMPVPQRISASSISSYGLLGMSRWLLTAVLFDRSLTSGQGSSSTKTPRVIAGSANSSINSYHNNNSSSNNNSYDAVAALHLDDDDDDGVGSDRNGGGDYLSASIPLWFPWMNANWWDPLRIISLLQEDVAATSLALESAESKAHKTHLELEKLDLRRSALLDHIKITRTQVGKVGARANATAKENKILKLAKTRLVQELYRQVAEKRQLIKNTQSTLNLCHEKFKNGQYSEIFELLELEFSQANIVSLSTNASSNVSVSSNTLTTTTSAMPPGAAANGLKDGVPSLPLEAIKSTSAAPSVTGTGPVVAAVSTDGNDKLRFASMDLIRSRESIIPELQTDLLETEARAKKNEADLKAFIQHSDLTSQLISKLGKQRFDTIVDVQEMVQRYTVNVEGLELEAEREVAVLSNLIQYRDEVLALIESLKSRKTRRRERMEESKRQEAIKPPSRRGSTRRNTVRRESLKNNRRGSTTIKQEDIVTPPVVTTARLGTISGVEFRRSFVEGKVDVDLSKIRENVVAEIMGMDIFDASVLSEAVGLRRSVSGPTPPAPGSPSSDLSLQGSNADVDADASQRSATTVPTISSSEMAVRSIRHKDTDSTGRVLQDVTGRDAGNGVLSRNKQSDSNFISEAIALHRSRSAGSVQATADPDEINTVSTVSLSLEMSLEQHEGGAVVFGDKPILSHDLRAEEEEMEIQVFEEYWRAMDSVTPKPKRRIVDMPVEVDNSTLSSVANQVSMSSEDFSFCDDSANSSMTDSFRDFSMSKTSRMWRAVSKCTKGRKGIAELPRGVNGNVREFGGGGGDSPLVDSELDEEEIVEIVKQQEALLRQQMESDPRVFMGHYLSMSPRSLDESQRVWRLEGPVIGNAGGDDYGASVVTSVSPSVSMAPNAMRTRLNSGLRPNPPFGATDWSPTTNNSNSHHQSIPPPNEQQHSSQGRRTSHSNIARLNSNSSADGKPMSVSSSGGGGIRSSTKILGRHEVQPVITKSDPFSVIGLKEVDRLKTNMEISRRVEHEIENELQEEVNAMNTTALSVDMTSSSAGVSRSSSIESVSRASFNYHNNSSTSMVAATVGSNAPAKSHRVRFDNDIDSDNRSVGSAGVNVIDRRNSMEDRDLLDDHHQIVPRKPSVVAIKRSESREEKSPSALATSLPRDWLHHGRSSSLPTGFSSGDEVKRMSSSDSINDDNNKVIENYIPWIRPPPPPKPIQNDRIVFKSHGRSKRHLFRPHASHEETDEDYDQNEFFDNNKEGEEGEGQLEYDTNEEYNEEEKAVSIAQTFNATYPFTKRGDTSPTALREENDLNVIPSRRISANIVNMQFGSSSKRFESNKRRQVSLMVEGVNKTFRLFIAKKRLRDQALREERQQQEKEWTCMEEEDEREKERMKIELEEREARELQPKEEVRHLIVQRPAITISRNSNRLLAEGNEMNEDKDKDWGDDEESVDSRLKPKWTYGDLNNNTTESVSLPIFSSVPLPLPLLAMSYNLSQEQKKKAKKTKKKQKLKSKVILIKTLMNRNSSNHSGLHVNLNGARSGGGGGAHSNLSTARGSKSDRHHHVEPTLSQDENDKALVVAIADALADPDNKKTSLSNDNDNDSKSVSRLSTPKLDSGHPDDSSKVSDVRRKSSDSLSSIAPSMISLEDRMAVADDMSDHRSVGSLLTGNTSQAKSQEGGDGSDNDSDDSDISYENLKDLVNDELHEAKLQKLAGEIESNHLSAKSELSVRLMKTCLQDLELRLMRLKPSSLIRGKGETRAELSRLLRETRLRGERIKSMSDNSTLSALDSPLLSKVPLLANGIHGRSLVSQTVSQDYKNDYDFLTQGGGLESYSYPLVAEKLPIAQPVLPLHPQAVIRDPWERAPLPPDLPLHGKALRPIADTSSSSSTTAAAATPHPLLVDNQSRLRKNFLKAKQYKEEEVILHKVCDNLMDDDEVDEDLKIGYASLIYPELKELYGSVLSTSSKPVSKVNTPFDTTTAKVLSKGPIEMLGSAISVTPLPRNSVESVSNKSETKPKAIIETESTQHLPLPMPSTALTTEIVPSKPSDSFDSESIESGPVTVVPLPVAIHPDSRRNTGRKGSATPDFSPVSGASGFSVLFSLKNNNIVPKSGRLSQQPSRTNSNSLYDIDDSHSSSSIFSAAADPFRHREEGSSHQNDVILGLSAQEEEDIENEIRNELRALKNNAANSLVSKPTASARNLPPVHKNTTFKKARNKESAFASLASHSTSELEVIGGAKKRILPQPKANDLQTSASTASLIINKSANISNTRKNTPTNESTVSLSMSMKPPKIRNISSAGISADYISTSPNLSSRFGSKDLANSPSNFNFSAALNTGMIEEDYCSSALSLGTMKRSKMDK